MIIDKDAIIINNIPFGKYLVQAEMSRPKLWGDDTGRSLSGDFNGTLLGIYPKFILQFKRLTKEELETIAPILDSASQTLTYYDPVKRAKITISTYTGDWGVVNKSIIGSRKNEGFSISFIARSRV